MCSVLLHIEGICKHLEVDKGMDFKQVLIRGTKVRLTKN